jgi:uracil-DNA glycosylase family 4
MAKIVFVGECYGEREAEIGFPFAGNNWRILRDLLSQTGIDKKDCAFTSVFPFRPIRGSVDSLMTSNRKEAVTSLPAFVRGKYLHQDHGIHIPKLFAFLEKEQPNLVVALGNAALWALTHNSGIKRWRGSPLLSSDQKWKVLPTWAPGSIARQWELRPIVFMDFHKIAREAESKLLVRPRRIIHLEPSLDDLEEFYEKYIVPAPILACDIETRSGQITEVGFATSPNRAIVVPFWGKTKVNYWPDIKSEIAAWKWVQRILEEKPIVGQNYSYDMQYFYRVMGITNPRFIGDTMLLQHTLQPELEKGLGFLGSVFTSEPNWKFMRQDHDTLKRED